jgi:murein DD-endopeptidase MepM/ murein hydrolase activator NlpD
VPVSGIGERGVYEPLAMGKRLKGRTPKVPKPQVLQRSYRRKPRQSARSAVRAPTIHSKPVHRRQRAGVNSELSGVKVLPLIAAALALMLFIGSGFLDDWILMTGPVENGPFPGDALPDIPILKASLNNSSPANTSTELVFTRHRVARDETLSRISYKYGLSPTTLISINSLKEPDDIRTGVVLIVPYMDGIRVSPKDGENHTDIAVRFETGSEMVQLIPGSTDFFVSGVSAEDTPSSSFARDVFLYPVTGRILTDFGEEIDRLTGISYQSEGIDLSAEDGSAVAASRDGIVILTGHHASYGLYVIMSHSGGWKSFYGHLSRVDVAPGDELESGTALGASGSSGTARSPRVHFALIHDNESVDPLDYLY